MAPVNWLLVLFEAAFLAPIVIGLRQIVREHRA